MVGDKLEDAVLVGANISLYGRDYMPVSRHEKEIERLKTVIDGYERRERIFRSIIDTYERDADVLS